MEPWNNLWADLSQGMANSQIEPWNNLWTDLSQGMGISQIEPWNNLWADLSQGMANSQMEPFKNLGWKLRLQNPRHFSFSSVIYELSFRVDGKIPFKTAGSFEVQWFWPEELASQNEWVFLFRARARLT